MYSGSKRAYGWIMTWDMREIDFQESGTGTPILFVPGSFSTPVAWRPIQKHLPDHYCFISFSLCGYGSTEESRTWDDCGPEHHLTLLEAVARQIDEPFHLVGHSFGSAIALAGVIEGFVKPLSVATYETNILGVLLETGRPELHQLMQQMRLDFEQAYRDGEADAASRIIDYWGGAGAYAAMPEAVRDYCRTTTFANVLDWHGWADYLLPVSDYAKIDMPVMLVRGGKSNEAMVEITTKLPQFIPDSRVQVVNGAGHFLTTTHAEQCAELLANFLAEVEHPKS